MKLILLLPVGFLACILYALGTALVLLGGCLARIVVEATEARDAVKGAEEWLRETA